MIPPRGEVCIDMQDQLNKSAVKAHEDRVSRPGQDGNRIAKEPCRMRWVRPELQFGGAMG